ncbi:MAG: class I SAM-dependent methyltransferase [Candidatus Marsarchaeota archaeon]|nr:class I SAM-dependent methyltransferase [Candidatus Marsarchaeota archaeon]
MNKPKRTVGEISGLWHIADRHVLQRAEMEAAYFAMLIRFWGRKFGEHPNKVLNVPCGLGRHDVYLRDEGFDVYGADIEKGFIETAKSRSPKFKDRYMVADMRRLPYPNGSFDVVANLFTSFGYFNESDNMKTVKEFARVLRPGGILVLDTHNKDPTIEKMMPIVADYLDNGMFRIVENKVRKDTWVIKTTLIKDGKNSMKKISTKITKVRLYSKEELEKMCKANGLDVLAVYGNYTVKPLTPGEYRMIFVVRKRK